MEKARIDVEEQEETNTEENIKESDHLMGPIVSPPLEAQVKSSDEKTITLEVPNDGQVIAIPHTDIDFILGDRLFLPKDCVRSIQIQSLMHLMVQFHIQAEFENQKKQCLRSISSWKNRYHEAFTLCTKDEDQVAHRRFVWLAFNPRGNLLNSRSSSLKEGES
eukprot:TRINITY_DN26507_c0_g2_i1.p1 TRINITY_DN26507_c0_g2~~TRINITY_DN26507_c0_g2_i1.p1  ORF type:complete len:185 (-),score=32.19 TRINITY_DN26507_c0_g2_i1:108-596(-)